MYAKTFGETVCGINGEEIIVEVDISNGLPEGCLIRRLRNRASA